MVQQLINMALAAQEKQWKVLLVTVELTKKQRNNTQHKRGNRK